MSSKYYANWAAAKAKTGYDNTSPVFGKTTNQVLLEIIELQREAISLAMKGETTEVITRLAKVEELQKALEKRNETKALARTT